MDPIEFSLILEKEKQKCLNVIQKYYEKNKNKDADLLYQYLKNEYEKCDDEYIKQTIKYDMELLENYVNEKLLL
jgi:hypothetical protein